MGKTQEEEEGWGADSLSKRGLPTPAALFIIPTIPLFSSRPVCFVSWYNDLAEPPHFLPPFYWLSSSPARTGAFMNTSIHSWAHFRNENQSGHWSGSRRMKVWDWGTEWLSEQRGQSSKAVGLSTSITRTRIRSQAQLEAPAWHSDSQAPFLLFWWNLWDENEKWQKVTSPPSPVSPCDCDYEGSHLKRSGWRRKVLSTCR